MSRARKIIESMDDVEVVQVSPEANEYNVSLAGDPQHTHEIQADSEGNGVLGKPSNGEDHIHNLVKWEVQPAGSYPHIHVIVKEEVVSPLISPDMQDIFKESPIAKALDSLGLGEADKEMDDVVSDTKEKVKVVIPKSAPNVRRVFDKTGKYVGSFDTKDKVDKNRYKTMFKGAK